MNRFSTVPPSALFRSMTLTGLAALAIGLTGCTVTPAAGYGYASETVVASPVVRFEPPEPKVEVVREAPFVGAIWIPGKWVWRHHAWHWRRGHWARPPRPEAIWVPGHWQHVPGGWVWRAGHWR